MLNSMARNRTERARRLALSGEYSEAFDLYLNVFEICPDTKRSLESEFRKLLSQYNEYMASDGRFVEVFNNFEHAIREFPSNVVILTDVGACLFKHGFFNESCQYYQQALSLDPGFVLAEKYINIAKNFMVDRWHFRMLNDPIRNSAYREALKQVIRPVKESILDIGTGTGLLTVYAYESSPMVITGIDKSVTMIDIARYVVNYQDTDNIILVAIDATNTYYQNIGGKRTLIIFELFDAGLLGENVLQILIHAHEHLTSINGKYLPARAELFAAGVQSDFLSSKYRIDPTSLHILGLTGIRVHLICEEPYDCEDIPLLKDAEIVTTKETIFKIDFNSLEDLKQKLVCDKPYEVTLNANRDGRIDVVLAFFNLHLTDNISLTTDPTKENRANAWQQAIFYDFVPYSVTECTSIPIQFTSSEGKLSLIKDNTTDTILRANADVIRFLNDKKYVKLILDCIGAVCIYLCQITEVSRLNVLDCCPFPVFGLMMMKRGVQNLTCYARTPLDRDFIIRVFEENNIPLSKIRIIMGEDLKMSAFKEDKYHTIFMNIIDLSGDINIKHKELMKQLKQKYLSPGGLILPYSVNMMGQIVNSPWLQRMNKVDDANTGTCSVAQFINKYQVSQNFNIDIVHLDYKKLSKEVIVTDCQRIFSQIIDAEIEESGDANAVLCWYQIQLIEYGEMLTTNSAGSFVDCMAFLADPSIDVRKGDIGNIMLCADADECFKLILDSDNDH